MSSAISFAADIPVAAQPAAAPTTSGIEEVIITAQKVAESQQSVPISVAAFSGRDIQNQIILKMQDLGERMTGVVISEASQGNAPTFSIRGNRIGHSVEGGVAVYFD